MNMEAKEFKLVWNSIEFQVFFFFFSPEGVRDAFAFCVCFLAQGVDAVGSIR